VAKFVQLDDVVCLVCAHIQVVFKHFHLVWLFSCEITELSLKVSGTKLQLTYTTVVETERTSRNITIILETVHHLGVFSNMFLKSSGIGMGSTQLREYN
jgi:hypothetical protein